MEEVYRYECPCTHPIPFGFLRCYVNAGGSNASSDIDQRAWKNSLSVRVSLLSIPQNLWPHGSRAAFPFAILRASSHTWVGLEMGTNLSHRQNRCHTLIDATGKLCSLPLSFRPKRVAMPCACIMPQWHVVRFQFSRS